MSIASINKALNWVCNNPDKAFAAAFAASVVVPAACVSIKNAAIWSYNNPKKAMVFSTVSILAMATLKNREAINQNLKYVLHVDNGGNDQGPIFVNRNIIDYAEAIFNGIRGKVSVPAQVLETGRRAKETLNSANKFLSGCL